MPDQNDDRISRYVDRQGVQNDTEFVIGQLNILKEKLADIDKIKVTLFGNNTISEVIKQIKELTITTSDLRKSQLEALKVEKEQISIRIQNAKAMEAEAKALKAFQAQQDASSKSASRPPKSSDGSSEERSSFQQLKIDAREAKDAYNSLLADQERGFAVLSSDIESAKQKWKSYEQQIRTIAIANKDAFNPERTAAINKRIAELKSEIASLQGPLNALKQKMTALATPDSSGNSKRFSQDFKDAAAKAALYEVKLRDLQRELAKLSSEEKQRQNIQRSAAGIEKQIDSEILKSRQLGNEYEALRLKLKLLEEEGLNLAAKGLTGPLSQQETKRLAELQTEATALAGSLVKIENQLGKGARAQSNYAAQLFSLQQVLRETPNIAFGWNIFLASLSNNIPILADDLKRLSERNKELRDAGKPTTSVIQQLGKALVSWSSIIAILVALFTIFSDKIIKFFENIFKSADAIKKAYLNSKEYYEQQAKVLQLQNQLIRAYTTINKLLDENNRLSSASINKRLAGLRALGVSEGSLFAIRQKLLDQEGERIKQESISVKQKAFVIIDDTQNKKIDDLIKKIQELEASGNTDFADAFRQQLEQEFQFLQDFTSGRLSQEEVLKQARLRNIEEIGKAEEERARLTAEYVARVKRADEESEPITKQEKEVFDKRFAQQDAILSNLKDNTQILTDFIDKVNDYETRQEELKNEKIAFASEQRRRKVLSDLTTIAEKTIQTNDDILSNDRSTERQRIQAVENIANARLDAAKAERDFALTAIGRTQADEVEAKNKFAVESEKIEIDRLKGIQDITDDFLSRRLSAEERSLEASKRLHIQTNNEIAESYLSTLERRQQALKAAFDAEKQLTDNKFLKELQEAGLSLEESVKFLDTGQTEINNAKATVSELEAIREDYLSTVSLMNEKFINDNLQTLITELDRVRNFIDESTGQIEIDIKEALNTRQSRTDESINYLRDLLSFGEINQKEFSKRTLRITRDSERERLKILEVELLRQLDLYKDSGAKRLAAEEIYLQAKQNLESRIGTEQEAQALKELSVARQRYQQAQDFYKRLLEITEELSTNRREQINLEQDFISADLDREMAMWEMRFSAISDIAQFGMSLYEAQHSRRMEMIDEESEALEKRYSREKGIIEQTVQNEEEKNQRLAELDLKNDNLREIIEAKRRRAERDAAIANKISAISNVLIEQLQTITRLKFQAAIYTASLNPIGAALALSQIPFVIANGALAVAGIAAQPLPKLALGTEDFEGGPVILGDAYKKELVVEPSGKAYLSSDTPEVYYLPKHSVVYPDADEVIDQVMMGSRNMLNRTISMHLSPFMEFPSFDKLNSTMSSGFHILTNTIKNKKELVLKRGINKDLLIRYGSDFYKYIN